MLMNYWTCLRLSSALVFIVRSIARWCYTFILVVMSRIALLAVYVSRHSRCLIPSTPPFMRGWRVITIWMIMGHIAEFERRSILFHGTRKECKWDQDEGAEVEEWGRMIELWWTMSGWSLVRRRRQRRCREEAGISAWFSIPWIQLQL